MRIALLLAAPWIPGSVDMTEYLRQLVRLGHESIMICRDFSQGPAGFDVVSADQATLEKPSFYNPLQLDAVIAFTWFNSDKIILAIKQAGINVLIRGDSDGLFSIRQFTAHHIRVRMSGTRGLLSKATGIKHLLQRYLFQYQIEDQARLASLAATDVAVLETQVARQNVIRFMRWQKRNDLTAKVKVVAHFVADEFIDAPVQTDRADSVVAIGRWEDPQKNASLLARTIELYLALHPVTQFTLIGGEPGRAAFTRLTATYSQVNYVGPQNGAGVRRHLANARVLMSSSRWEGSPVVANEALAMGVSIVGTPIPAFVDITSKGFGTIAKDHSAKSLSAALLAEMQAWQNHERDSKVIAEYWRPRLSSKVIVAELVQLVSGQPLPRTPALHMADV